MERTESNKDRLVLRSASWWPGEVCLCAYPGPFYRRRGPASKALSLPDPRRPARNEDTPLPRSPSRPGWLRWSCAPGPAGAAARLLRKPL
jgi:hypothetical protein